MNKTITMCALVLGLTVVACDRPTEGAYEEREYVEQYEEREYIEPGSTGATTQQEWEAQQRQGKPDEPDLGAAGGGIGGGTLEGDDLGSTGGTGTGDTSGLGGGTGSSGTSGLTGVGGAGTTGTTGSDEAMGDIDREPSTPGTPSSVGEPGTPPGIGDDEEDQFGPRTDPSRFGEDDDDIGTGTRTGTGGTTGTGAGTGRAGDTT
ncbi:MAG: hypothetical protein M3Y87_14525, partial [Myxococcota bacterium]|nr:hypothetical protein [Myxococcota bacterium]